jgi:hypothetical protein
MDAADWFAATIDINRQIESGTDNGNQVNKILVAIKTGENYR